MAIVKDGAVILPSHVKALALNGQLIDALWIDGVKVCETIPKYVPVETVRSHTSARLTVRAKGTAQASGGVTPANATDKTILWRMTDTSIATINKTKTDGTGVTVRGVKAGNTMLWATSVDGPQHLVLVVVS
ncbi:MAG: Ig-like domain-containing protein [Oscillospiraceae bacterium]|jgi:hypothetical protein|nr:Ig-like domain-containing protein [Oscillospiraceae bacterium]